MARFARLHFRKLQPAVFEKCSIDRRGVSRGVSGVSGDLRPVLGWERAGKPRSRDPGAGPASRWSQPQSPVSCVSMQGSNLTEGKNAVCERALSAHGGYAADNAHAIILDAISADNTTARTTQATLRQPRAINGTLSKTITLCLWFRTTLVYTK